MRNNLITIVESLRRIQEEGDESNYVHFTVSAGAERYYYIQLAGERGQTSLYAEAVGNENLEPNSALNEKQIWRLQSMGWNPPPPGDFVGNFYRKWEASDDNDRLVTAKKIMRTFIEVYGVVPDEPLEVDLYLGEGQTPDRDSEHIDFWDYIDKSESYRDFTDFVYKRQNGEVYVERSHYERLPGEPVSIVSMLGKEIIPLDNLTPTTLSQVLRIAAGLVGGDKPIQGKSYEYFHWDNDRSNHKAILKKDSA